ncbi:McrB family protein [Companilactobacillus sp.]|uniref:McrB family protein n=1 Tax=Companilactobacillus sp. TaxID=2767905 RepID=UPI0025C245F9|nr:AAA family ATPase [Companilactobacillus sp.]MCH4010001.1 AAA family ATPase [Companilactobacillus sp.]MCH4052323.1 AAA family ATPase [Companilactobacillus sp.]MCH4077943.1 AAA family ATPase [Companilactobacillus sp.]MCH4126519.1 AAA family ATPase [Companilactobacillus sp.]MCH4132105.1 AAA family ATPase [Companilactobacillus sp.]
MTEYDKSSLKVLCKIENEESIDLSGGKPTAKVKILSNDPKYGFDSDHTTITLQTGFEPLEKETQHELWQRIGEGKVIACSLSKGRDLYANEKTGSKLFDTADDFTNDDEYLTFPIFFQSEDYPTVQKYISMLKEDGGLYSYFWKDEYPLAKIIVFKTNDSIFYFDGINKQETNNDGFTKYSIKKIEKLKFNPEFFNKHSYSVVQSDEVQKTAVGFISKKYFDESIDETEGLLIDDFKREASKQGLYYSDDDLINFHTAMKSDGMVVLAGLSGTGKTQMVRTYAKTLGIENRTICIPVQSSWTDDSDLLGFMNYQTGNFQPGDSGLADILIDGSKTKNKNKLYIVELDEMNLAKVEHYFAQFLSVLEMDGKDREITLFSDENHLNVSKNGYPSKVHIGNNIMFVGTINTDESTYKFSDKVLDRSNVIRMNIIPFYEPYENQKNQENRDIDDDENIRLGAELVNQQDNQGTYSLSDFYLMNDSLFYHEPDTDELTFLWNIHEAINSADQNTGIGWRVVKQIENYLDNLPKNLDDGITREDGMDFQIKQRILPKITGSIDLLRNLIGEDVDKYVQKEKIQPEYKDNLGTLRNILQYGKAKPDENNKVSVKDATLNSEGKVMFPKYNQSMDAINTKAKDLNNNEFTI